MNGFELAAVGESGGKHPLDQSDVASVLAQDFLVLTQKHREQLTGLVGVALQQVQVDLVGHLVLAGFDQSLLVKEIELQRKKVANLFLLASFAFKSSEAHQKSIELSSKESQQQCLKGMLEE